MPNYTPISTTDIYTQYYELTKKMDFNFIEREFLVNLYWILLIPLQLLPLFTRPSLAPSATKR